jgi:uncharacterized membrane protein YhiD involved in acid resistance
LWNSCGDELSLAHDKNLENAIGLLCGSNFKHKAFKDWQFWLVLNTKFEKQFSKINNKIKVMSLLFFVFSYIFIHTA